MESAGLKQIPERCVSIRWKGMFIDTEWDPSKSEPTSEHIPWCVRTQNCMGPDAQVVALDSCNLTRSCYERI